MARVDPAANDELDAERVAAFQRAVAARSARAHELPGDVRLLRRYVDRTDLVPGVDQPPEEIAEVLGRLVPQLVAGSLQGRRPRRSRGALPGELVHHRRDDGACLLREVPRLR